MNARLEPGPVVGLDRLDRKRQPLEQLVEKLDRGRLAVARVHAKHPDAGAIVDGGELGVLAP